MTSRNWICTLNNPQVGTQEFLELWHTKGGAKYVCGQLEKGEEGTPHIQYYLWFKDAIRMTALKKHCKNSHFEKVRADQKAQAYVMKEETRLEGPFEYGEKPVKRNSKEDWEEVKQNAISGNFDKIPADIFVKHYGNLKMINKDNMPLPKEEEGLRGIWIWGESGVGKSRMARDKYAGDKPMFPKMRNKWWDGYQGEEIVIMEDLDPDSGKYLGGFIKDWTDRYPLRGETKNGGTVLRHKQFVITSQYTPEELWTDSKTIEAIRRRCKFIHISNPLGINRE